MRQSLYITEQEAIPNVIGGDDLKFFEAIILGTHCHLEENGRPNQILTYFKNF